MVYGNIFLYLSYHEKNVEQLSSIERPPKILFIIVDHGAKNQRKFTTIK